jgi:hypothetical protein
MVHVIVEAMVEEILCLFSTLNVRNSRDLRTYTDLKASVWPADIAPTLLEVRQTSRRSHVSSSALSKSENKSVLGRSCETQRITKDEEHVRGCSSSSLYSID